MIQLLDQDFSARRHAHRDYQLERIAPELRDTILKTPPVRFESVWKARFGIWMMHRFMPSVDTDGVHVDSVRVPVRDGRSIRCRLYSPAAKTAEQERPAMVFMHWGGFVVGNLKTEHARCVRLCRDHKLVVLSVEYRKAPEHPFPAGLHDCYDALRWLHDNSITYGVNAQNIGVGGTSAGGGLAASLALMARDLDGPKVAWQYLGFPVLDASCSSESARLYVDTPNWTSKANTLMWRYYLGDGELTGLASPLLADSLSGLPPAVIWTAEFDPLRDEGALYASRLWESGSRVHFYCYERAVHGFDSFPVDVGIVKRARQEVGAALDELVSGHSWSTKSKG
ncbi:MAG: alpha/beta hydrolase [Myxococcota bacterium]